MNRSLRVGSRSFDLSRPVVMGILNVTPDSFSDGGRFDRVDAALAHALQMQQEGADIIDIGGESTRPGAQPVDADAELQRTLPVIEAIRRQSDIPISIDTSKPRVMREAIAAGANMVNDINALRESEAVAACAGLNVPVCLMPMQGEPRTMQHRPAYDDVVSEVIEYLEERVEACLDAGIDINNIVLDPGFGFGKTLLHNLELLNGIDTICGLELPVLVGISRKSMLGAILDNKVEERLYASVAAAVLAWTKGARLFRVHDVAATVEALKVCDATVNQSRFKDD